MVNEPSPHEAIVPGKPYNKPHNVWREPYRLGGLLVVPIEVLLRRNFGQRWFTFLNFLGGLFLLSSVAAIEWGLALFLDDDSYRWLRAHALDDWHVPVFYSLPLKMPWVAAAYLVFSVFHFLRMWWRNRTDRRRHSYDDGTSWLEPVAYGIMRLLNLLAAPFMHFFRLFLPRSVRRGRKLQPMLTNVTRFTGMVVEPLSLVGVSFVFSGVARVWLWASALATVHYSYRKSRIRQNKFLDFSDTVVESRYMKNRYNNSADTLPNKTEMTWQQQRPTWKKSADTKPQSQYPDLDEIIDKLNRDGEHLAN